MTKRIRIRDIATQAGVSAGAVSRALKGQPGLKDETRQRILTIAQQQGYDFTRLRSDKIRRVLFLLHRQHNISSALSFYSPLLLGVENACREEGIALSFLALGPTDAIEEQVRRHDPDALLCAGFFEPELLAVLQSMQLPLALIDLWSPNLPSVNPDNVQGGYLATRHLIEQGRTRIAFLASSLAHYSIRLREKGYRQALYEAKLLTPPEYEVIAPPLLDTETSLINAVEELLALPQRPDAIFAYNDSAALIAMRVCQRHGLSVPEDVAVVGFDDIETARVSHPPLTTIAIDKAELGRQGLQLLLNAVPPEEQRQLAVTLIARKSAGEDQHGNQTH
ncbi:LacI family DNA-binding transcriptional regulator [Pectobacteriaceae bacterium CE70]|uniref:LacI family transcriptional regulator n=1 Tax=Serratia sp. (strain ATCC 39006) TaxID=104623 RepID=A0A2I5T4H6_SERS3|nr:LacI family DNA-binding transcriptional regulator [Serratia sp. ATCC 39006]WJV61940.1 LacI family DNA-binding transcriptional regulator [Pectobacteriaceae bacterium C52]WJV66211.1 LacI family DNA-binding transcriptional regulator [Pectobacteriaceae bacterium CE70]WJY10220.1 LacI family DNA-binding transcriptional regulator [Pectobacteriaceae bacterium C80]AUG99472.1 LacI family transcriptional regulator [Serratia sp. ATCC 39006]AUH03790.1 LacI family transcriptional regulator [Serratia sp. 